MSLNDTMVAVKPNQALMSLIQDEWEGLQPAVGRLYSIVDEQERIREMMALYDQRTRLSAEPDKELLGNLRHRDQILEDQLDEIAPVFEYSQALRRVIMFFQDEASARHAADKRDYLRNARRQNARRWIQMIRRSELSKAAAERSDAEQSTSERPRGSVRLFGGNRPSESRLSPHVAINEASRALSLLQEDETPPGERIAKVVREYLESHKSESERFGTLYKTLLSDRFPDLFKTSSSDSARLEAFRYHFMRAAEKFGLRYDAGLVCLDRTEL